LKLWHKLLIALAVTSGSTLGVTNLLNQPSEDLVFGATKAPATQGGTNLDAYRKGDLLYSPASISLASPGANSLARLASGSAGQCLIMSGGIPAWSSSCGGGSSNFTGLDFGVIGGTQVKITSQSFDAGMFNLSNTASHGFVRLDWVNGPASRSASNTWSALNIFSSGASFSHAEFTNTASAQTYKGGVLALTGTGTNTLSGDLNIGAGTLLAHSFRGDATDGALIEANNGTDVAIFGAGNTTNISLLGATSVTGNLLPSTNNTYSLGISGQQWLRMFSQYASVSSNLEVAGVASASQLYGAGLSSCTGSNFLQWNAGLFGCAAGGGGGRPASNSLDWDEFVVNMTLDQTHSIASAGFGLNFTTGGLGVKSGGKIDTPFEVGGIASISSIRTRQIFVGNGGSTTPGIALQSATQTGFYDAGGFFGMTFGGTARYSLGFSTIESVTTGGFLVNGGAGTVSNPTLSFKGSGGVGFYPVGTTSIGVAAGSVQVGSISLSRWEIIGTASISSSVFMNGLTTATGTPNSICQNGTEITVNAALTCTVSSAEYKTEIGSFFGDGIVGSMRNTEALDLVAQLQPRQFAYKDQPNRLRWGFLSEEVSAVDPKLGDAIQPDGHAKSIDIAGLIALNTKAIQELYQLSGNNPQTSAQDNDNDVVFVFGVLIAYVLYNELDKRRNYIKK